MKKADENNSNKTADSLSYPKCSPEMENVALNDMYIPKSFRDEIKDESKWARSIKRNKSTEPKR